MKILFIQDNGINESLALCDVSSLLKSNGHHCDIVIERNEKDFLATIKKLSPDLFIVPWDVGGNIWALDIAKRLKDNFKNPIVFCGTYPTFHPAIIENPLIDVICLGESEYALLELANNLQKGEEIEKIQNLWIKKDGEIIKNELRPLISDLDELPLPDRGIYYKYSYLKNTGLKRFTSGRGCPNSCSFCYNPTFKKIYAKKGKYVRRKSVNRIIEEIKDMKENYPLKSIHFSDDLFTHNKSWVMEFSEKYKANFKIPFTCNTTVNEIDEEMIIAMKEANCSGIAIGVETGNEKLRMEVLNKPFSDEKIIEAARLIKKHKIYLTTFNMIAIPKETLKDAFKTVELNRKLKADNPRITILVPIPNTPLVNQTISQGYLEKDFEKKSKKNMEAPYFKSKYVRQFENLYSLFGLAVKWRWFDRILKRIINLPPNPFFKLFILFQFLRERRFFNMSLFSAIRLYIYGGNPNQRTKNFNNYIP